MFMQHLHSTASSPQFQKVRMDDVSRWVQQTDKKENMDCDIELLFCYVSVKTQDGLNQKYDQAI